MHEMLCFAGQGVSRKMDGEACPADGSFVFCNTVCADRIVMVASRLLGTAAMCVVLLSFAARHRKSYWSGCIKAPIVICQQIFSNLALVIFLSKFLFKKRFEIQNRPFFSLASRSGLGAADSDAFARSSIVLCTSVSANRIVMAA